MLQGILSPLKKLDYGTWNIAIKFCADYHEALHETPPKRSLEFIKIGVYLGRCGSALAMWLTVDFGF